MSLSCKISYLNCTSSSFIHSRFIKLNTLSFTLSSWGPIGHKLITDIGRTIAGITKNPKSTSFIFQAISMAVQQGNVQCVQGAYGEPAFEELDEIFYIVKPNNIF